MALAGVMCVVVPPTVARYREHQQRIAAEKAAAEEAARQEEIEAAIRELIDQVESNTLARAKMTLPDRP